jgi:ParB-like chromosome segregation protein Spo0J
MSGAKVSFEMRRIRVPLENILPVRHVKDPRNNIKRYRVILSSIKQGGMIEPLVIYPQKGAVGKYMLVDGHLRLIALKELGEEDAECIVADDDECFTYNARVSRLAPIQEHKMIVRAVRSGVSVERIAEWLNRSVAEVQAWMSLLDGIHPDAAELLKDKAIAPKAMRCLKKVTGVRQIEMAELMVSANNYTSAYADAMVMGTPKEMLLNPEEPKQKEGLTPEEIAKMEEEMEALERDVKAYEESYGDNMLNLTGAKAYIKRLLDNAKVVRFLNAHYGDISAEFEKIAAAETM